MDKNKVEKETIAVLFIPAFFLYFIMNLTQSEIKYLRSFRLKKYRDTERKFLLEGWRPLRDALKSSFPIEMIAVLAEERSKTENALLFALAKDRGIAVKEVKALQLRQISDEEHSQGVVALVHQQTRLFDALALQSANLIVACDHISDPGNLGTIIRTCDWFGADAVLLSKVCVSLYNEKVVRSTAGSIFHLPVSENIDLNIAIANLKPLGFKIIATTLDGKPLNNFVFPNKTILILGSEAHGISSELIKQTDKVLSIPSYGKAESLNVGIACGVFLAHWRNQSAT